MNVAQEQAVRWDLSQVSRYGYLRDITNDAQRHRRHELLERFITFEGNLGQVQFASREAETNARALWTEIREWLRARPMEEFSYRRMKRLYG